MNFYYFAYGSNLSSKRMRSRGVKFVEFKKIAIKDYELRFTAGFRTGFANMEPCKGSQIEGFLYSVTAEGILQLDAFEGHPDFYRRVIFKLEEFDLPIVVYIATDEYKLPGRTSPKYLTIIKEGMIERGIDWSKFRELKSFKAKRIRSYSSNFSK